MCIFMCMCVCFVWPNGKTCKIPLELLEDLELVFVRFSSVPPQVIRESNNRVQTLFRLGEGYIPR